jgi:hypothetical protein
MKAFQNSKNLDPHIKAFKVKTLKVIKVSLYRIGEYMILIRVEVIQMSLDPTTMIRDISISKMLFLSTKNKNKEMINL